MFMVIALGKAGVHLHLLLNRVPDLRRDDLGGGYSKPFLDRTQLVAGRL